MKKEPSEDSLEAELLKLFLLQLVLARLRQSRSTSRTTQYSSSSQADKRETTAENTAPPQDEKGSKDESGPENTGHTKSGEKTEEKDNAGGTSENTVPLQDEKKTEERKNQTTSENNKETEVNKEKCESKNRNEEKTVETECQIMPEITSSPQDVKDEKETEAGSKITTPFQDEIETEETESAMPPPDDNEVDKNKDEFESQSTEHTENKKRIIEEESQTSSEITVHSQNTKEQKQTEENKDQSVSESTEHVETEEKQHKIISQVITLQDETGIIEAKNQTTSENPHQGGSKIKDSKDELGSQSADQTGNGKKSKKKKNQTSTTQITVRPQNKNSQKEAAKMGKGEAEKKEHTTISKTVTLLQGEREAGVKENKSISDNITPPNKDTEENKDELGYGTTDRTEIKKENVEKESQATAEVAKDEKETKEKKYTEHTQGGEETVEKKNQTTPDTNESESTNIDHIKNAEKTEEKKNQDKEESEETRNDCIPGEAVPASELQSTISSIKVNVQGDIFEKRRSPIRDFPSFITLPPKSTTLGTKLLDSSKPIASKVYLPVDSQEFSALKRDQVPRKVLLLSVSPPTTGRTAGLVPTSDLPSFLLLSRDLIVLKTELLDNGSNREEVYVPEQELWSSNSPKNSSKASFAPEHDCDAKPEESSFPDELITEPVPQVPKVDNDQNVSSHRTGTFVEGDTSRKPSSKPPRLIDPSCALGNVCNLSFDTPPSATLEHQSDICCQEVNTFHEPQSSDASDPQPVISDTKDGQPNPTQLSAALSFIQLEHTPAAIKRFLPHIFTSNEVSRMLTYSELETSAKVEPQHSTVLEEASALAKVPVASEHQRSISHEEESAFGEVPAELELQSTSRGEMRVKVDILSLSAELSTEPAVMEEGLPQSSTLSEVSDLPLDSDSRISSPEDPLIQEEDESFSLSENSEPRASSIMTGREESSDSSLISEADNGSNSSISVEDDNV